MPSQAHGGHLLFVSIPAWGHLRAQAALAAKLFAVQADSPPDRRTVITLLTVGGYADRVRGEIALIIDSEPPQLKKELNEWLRVISLGGEGLDLSAVIPVLFAEFGGYYHLLLAGQPVTCKQTGKVYDAAPKPAAAVIDFASFTFAQIILAFKTPMPIVVSVPTSASFLFNMVEPDHLGNGQARIAAEISKGSKTPEEIKVLIEEEWFPNKGDVVSIPGMQPFYDYEFSPQEPSGYLTFPDVVSGMFHILTLGTTILLTSTPAYEPEALPTLRDLLEKSGKKLFAIGPLFPAPARNLREQGGNQDRVTSFLDAALKSHGSKSILYISFGSLYWPPKSEYIWAWLEKLLELRIPFICSTASPLSNVPEALKSRIDQSGLGMVTAWAPQQVILTHEATGWFMSHCGYNSVTEAIAAGVPIIAWPMEGDQPTNAAYLSLTLNTSFELVQVRTGVRGLRPLHRGANSASFVQPQGTVEAVSEEAHDILRRARGEEGQEKRRNVEALREKFHDAWSVGGDARSSLEALVTQLRAA